MFGLPIGLLLDDVVELVFGVDTMETFGASVIAIIGAITIFILIVYYFVPLRCDQRHDLK